MDAEHQVQLSQESPHVFIAVTRAGCRVKRVVAGPAGKVSRLREEPAKLAATVRLRSSLSQDAELILQLARNAPVHREIG